jgi:meiotic recombination protein SPO11
MQIYVLTDFDPHGIDILRCYKYDSARMSRGRRVVLETAQWLGIRKVDLFSQFELQVLSQPGYEIYTNGDNSQMTSTDRNLPGSHDQQTSVCSRAAMALSNKDRDTGTKILRRVKQETNLNEDSLQIMAELQVMLMLDLKVSIQQVIGTDLPKWLDDHLTNVAS